MSADRGNLGDGQSFFEQPRDGLVAKVVEADVVDVGLLLQALLQVLPEPLVCG